MKNAKRKGNKRKEVAVSEAQCEENTTLFKEIAKAQRDEEAKTLLDPILWEINSMRADFAAQVRCIQITDVFPMYIYSYLCLEDRSAMYP